MRVWAVLSLGAGVMLHADTTGDHGVPHARPLEEVVTTATSKSEAEAAQDVPLAVTVLGGEALAERRVTDLEDLSHALPNVALDGIGTGKGIANFSIRGLGVAGSIPSIDPTVGVFVDGGDLVDVSVALAPNDRVEFTLYGRNLLDEVLRRSDFDLTGFVHSTYSPLKEGSVVGLEVRGALWGLVGGRRVAVVPPLSWNIT